MPLNVRRFYSSIFLVFAGFITGIFSQTQQAVNQPSPVPPTAAPINAAPTNTTPIKTLTAGEIMRERISKAKAFIAVRNYNAAIYELEMIRRETSDSSVHAVTNILLMNSYLEQGNYTKAQNFLNEAYKNFKANNANGSMFYSAVAGQVVKGARSKLERYRSLGLTVSDRNLPLEAVNDIEKMRETLELVVTQTREAGGLDKDRSSVAMPLLEEATAARSILARDDYDAKRWRDEGTDIREGIASSRSIVINATDGAILQNNSPAIQQQVVQQTPSNTGTVVPAISDPKPLIAVPETHPTQLQSVTANNKPSETALATTGGAPVSNSANTDAGKQLQQQATDKPAEAAKAVPAADSTQKQQSVTADSNTEKSSPVNVGSLIEYATTKQQPTYPPAARSMRAAGVVKVEVVVDETGQVTEVKNVAGHTLLVAAARDAVRKWKFRPIMRDGQAVRASGYVNFNFTL
ncbi:MAG: energy transducer TonB [Pyrinomonadaceae bacterium]